MKEILKNLNQILSQKEGKVELIKKSQNFIFNSERGEVANEEQEEILWNLAYDIEYCFNSSGELEVEKLHSEIKEALQKLNQLYN